MVISPFECKLLPLLKKKKKCKLLPLSLNGFQDFSMDHKQVLITHFCLCVFSFSCMSSMGSSVKLTCSSMGNLYAILHLVLLATLQCWPLFLQDHLCGLTLCDVYLLGSKYIYVSRSYSNYEKDLSLRQLWKRSW